MGRSKGRRKKAGMAPGTVLYTGEPSTDAIRLRVITYDETKVEETSPADVGGCLRALPSSGVTWINVDGIHDVSVVERMGQHFGLHPLLMEDIVNPEQRPKVENFGDRLYFVLCMLRWDEEKREIESEQVSIVLGPGFVISFQAKPGDVFHPVREHIRGGKGRIRKLSGDYLAYALIDAIVDQYFVILEKIGERVEALEEEVSENPATDTLSRVHTLRRELVHLRRSIWPLREVLGGLQREEAPLIGDTTRIFLRDVYDHTIQVIDTIESYREAASGLLEIYLSMVSLRMNEVMKVLTIIATLFIPLTFVTGIYGMNFDSGASPYNMPELHWRYGYPAFWIVMVAVAALMFVFFRRRRWM